MDCIARAVLFVSICGAASFAGSDAPVGRGLVLREASDASAAVAIGENAFIVADDENNVLRVYRTDGPGLPLSSYDLTDFLDIDPEHPEADIEGATKIGNRVYWITSHGRNKDGKIRPNRYRFFATDVRGRGGNVTVHPAGKPYKKLVHELLKVPHAAAFGFDRSTRLGENLGKRERRKLAPKENGLNIEGLCASVDGMTIFIGFRNPLPQDRAARGSCAIVVPLKNASDLVESGERPVFGAPALWYLGDLGIRSMEYSHFHEQYFIIAGRPDESDEFVLYRWSGARAAPRPVRKLNSFGPGFTPEALVPFADGRLLLLSDDGSLPIKVAGPSECEKGEYRRDGTCLNKHLTDPARKTFRGMWLAP